MGCRVLSVFLLEKMVFIVLYMVLVLRVELVIRVVCIVMLGIVVFWFL